MVDFLESHGAPEAAPPLRGVCVCGLAKGFKIKINMEPGFRRDDDQGLWPG
jgi:hypothetical protein